ncbi:hypothetical protein EAE96_004427 [Botrytis aclada]|nr:hypothetical protein EAE96_004427 [Botrytis aclada]
MVWKYRLKSKKQNQETLCKSPGTELVAISNNVAPTKKSEFKGFPLDVINILFDILYDEDERTTIICLALTCRSCWNFFQGKPWKGFKFGTMEDGSFYERCFIELIESWIGPGYRRIGPDSRYIETPFLSRAVYGDHPGVEEKILNDRWKDYKMLDTREDPYRATYHVPKPFGVSADTWFPLAARQLKKEVLSWETLNDTRAKLAAAFHSSSLYRWLLSNGGQAWLLANRAYKKSKICNTPSMAVLLYFPDEGQSWPTEPKRPKPTGKGPSARKLRKADRMYLPVF